MRLFSCRWWVRRHGARDYQERSDESAADFSTQQVAPQTEARLSAPHVDPMGPRGVEKSASRRTQAPFGVNRAGGRRYPRTARLTRSAEFDAVFAAQRSRRYGPLRLFWKENRGDGWRLGLVVSRKVGPAHVRNKLKRRLREIFRVHREEWNGSRDLVILAYPELAGLGGKELEARVLDAVSALPAREAPSAQSSSLRGGRPPSGSPG